MINFRKKDRNHPLTPGQRALIRAQSKQSEVDSLVAIMVRRVEENHFAESINALMGRRY